MIKRDIVVEIAVGSTLQLAQLVAPLLVLTSLFMPLKMPLVFTIPELMAMVIAVFLGINVTMDGESNWFKRLTLLMAYLIMDIGFYLL